MTKLSLQRLFDWSLDGVQYSGSEASTVDAVGEYSDAIASSNARQKYAVSFADTSYSVPISTEEKGSTPSKEQSLLHDISDIEQYFQRKPTHLPRNSLVPIQEWEGWVDSIGPKSFFVKLANVNDRDGVPMDEAEFDLSELSNFDRSILRIGSIVRWVIGFEKQSTDMRQKVSRIHIRRLPVFTDSDLEEARLKADALLSQLNLDEGNRAE